MVITVASIYTLYLECGGNVRVILDAYNSSGHFPTLNVTKIQHHFIEGNSWAYGGKDSNNTISSSLQTNVTLWTERLNIGSVKLETKLTRGKQESA